MSVLWEIYCRWILHCLTNLYSCYLRYSDDENLRCKQYTDLYSLYSFCCSDEDLSCLLLPQFFQTLPPSFIDKERVMMFFLYYCFPCFFFLRFSSFFSVFVSSSIDFCVLVFSGFRISTDFCVFFFFRFFFKLYLFLVTKCLIRYQREIRNAQNDFRIVVLVSKQLNHHHITQHKK